MANIPAEMESQLLQFAFSHEDVTLLRGSGWNCNENSDDYLLAFDAEKLISAENGIKEFQSNRTSGKYWFGHFDYDLKNQLESLTSDNQDEVQFPTTSFFSPRFIVQKKGGQLQVLKGNIEIENVQKRGHEAENSGEAFTNLKPRISESQYLEKLAEVKRHLMRGDIYQVNFCQEFFAENAKINPLQLFQDAFSSMPNPYSVLYKRGDHFALSFSPEGFLSKRGNSLISQPMKGTSPRSSDPIQDKVFREQLETSEKDRRENVMITDLVRNDLSHFAAKGSVKVPELCKVVAYPRVHQMISKVVCELKPETDPMEAILKTFPMGSMTGAPKISAMKIIEELEETKRGLYSGAIGYFDPQDDFDFNVVIRTLIYNASMRYLSCQVGGGITALSDHLAEYEECRVKLEPLAQFLNQSQIAALA